eukprot:CAMPEP_0176032116 /NCGR_PEP_ID=MMETSP0120_2-20121206/15848_1 /TAXON_ID=160619 /ORGANISM="Kryptoperidinium foliaceum, Strain CCMP 1326" /LENGTH=160 /DNA_ID=CAMNT_0017365429 /DNA_START=237 /DNA_END=716 /DNA_ORIENTATION=-
MRAELRSAGLHLRAQLREALAKRRSLDGVQGRGHTEAADRALAHPRGAEEGKRGTIAVRLRHPELAFGEVEGETAAHEAEAEDELEAVPGEEEEGHPQWHLLFLSDLVCDLQRPQVQLSCLGLHRLPGQPVLHHHPETLLRGQMGPQRGAVHAHRENAKL